MINKWPLLLSLFIIIACHSNTDNGTKTVNDEKQDIEAVITDFSKFLASGDTNGLGKICTTQFILLEDGKFYDLQALLQSVTGALVNATMTRTPNNISINQRNNIAWAHYRITGEFKSGGQTIPLSLLEMLVLEKSGNQWKIVQAATMQAAANQ